jgi:molecular chaperone GrpE
MTESDKPNQEDSPDSAVENEALTPEPEETVAAESPETGAETGSSEASFGEESAEAAAGAAAQEAQPEEDYKDQYLRLRADFENFRKRTRKEKEDWTQRCLENICTDLLTILDHFDLGLENAKGQEIPEETLQGFELIRGQLGTVLGKYGLEPVEAESGIFDPNLHEAITHLPSTEVPEGEVVAMTRKGYQLGSRLLRPAQVVVSAGEGEG